MPPVPTRSHAGIPSSIFPCPGIHYSSCLIRACLFLGMEKQVYSPHLPCTTLPSPSLLSPQHQLLPVVSPSTEQANSLSCALPGLGTGSPWSCPRGVGDQHRDVDCDLGNAPWDPQQPHAAGFKQSRKRWAPELGRAQVLLQEVSR